MPTTEQPTQPPTTPLWKEPFFAALAALLALAIGWAGYAFVTAGGDGPSDQDRRMAKHFLRRAHEDGRLDEWCRELETAPAHLAEWRLTLGAGEWEAIVELSDDACPLAVG